MSATPKYEQLTPSQIWSLPATNYHKMLQGKELVDVPESDTHYHTYFNAHMKPEDHTLVLRPQPTPIPTFSFFEKPVTNISISKSINIAQLYNTITGHYFKNVTTEARQLYQHDRKAYSKFKVQAFNYVTFSGQFTKRNDASLIKHSGLICIDLDHLHDVSEMRERLLSDESVSTELLFISPSGNGLKWVISIDISQASHLEYFFAFQNYVRKTYGLEIDRACKDVSRACLIPHDEHAYINTKWLQA